MATYEAITGLIGETEFGYRLKVALIKAALAISTEDPGAVNHTERIALAQGVLRAPDTYADCFSIPVALNSKIAETRMKSTDEDYDVAVASVWDALALAGV